LDTHKGILPDSKKYDVIEKYSVPTDAGSARGFVAFCNDDLLKKISITHVT